MIRALEIHARTGKPPSAVRRATPPAFASLLLGLAVPLEELDRRIAARVDAMLQAGLLEEVETLRARHPGLDPAALGIGYAEVAQHLSGRASFEEMRSGMIRHTRQYARRQLTWFRRDPQVHWIPAEVPAAVAQVQAAIMEPEAI